MSEVKKIKVHLTCADTIEIVGGDLMWERDDGALDIQDLNRDSEIIATFSAGQWVYVEATERVESEEETNEAD